MAARTLPTPLTIQPTNSYNYEPPSPPTSPQAPPSPSPSNSDCDYEVAMILFQEARRSSISPSRHPSAYQTPVRISHKHLHSQYRMPLTPPSAVDGFEADSENDLTADYDEVDEDLLHNVQRVLNASSTGAAMFLSDELDGLMDEHGLDHHQMSSKIHHDSIIEQVAFDEDTDDWSGWSSDQFPSEDEVEWEAFGKSLRDALGAPKSSPVVLDTLARKRKHSHDESPSDSEDSEFTANSCSPSGKKKPKASTARSTAVVSITDENGLRMCMYCSCTETPMWRHGPPGHEDLCNKCGIKWMRGRILQDARAPATANAGKRRESTRR
ncbi:hypothetical protein SeMB42_g01901 [Synchytrium endobioticum]|uniref:GATA-type domain-containing protein n=1 Tax=Synchytrium endobioticum TaxID=286115 RepID=A0A507DJ50_9FUNG|nr:hypothetical protein SeMB42_g01901 [Synchytrium endobioticum]